MDALYPDPPGVCRHSGRGASSMRFGWSRTLNTVRQPERRTRVLVAEGPNSCGPGPSAKGSGSDDRPMDDAEERAVGAEMATWTLPNDRWAAGTRVPIQEASSSFDADGDRDPHGILAILVLKLLRNWIILCQAGMHIDSHAPNIDR